MVRAPQAELTSPFASLSLTSPSPASMLDILNLESLEPLARERLDPMLFDYMAGGAADEGTIFCASTVSNCSLEAIAAASNGPRWFQLYVYRDKSVTRELVDRAVAAGYGALCLTVDTPLAGPRERDRRNSLRMPAHLQLGNFPASHSKEHHEGATGVSALAHYIAAQWDAGLTWADVDWLRSISPVPVIVKGILAPGDAVLALEHGAEAVIVSNHGGRQLDTVPAPATLLRAVVDAVAGRAEVLVDGGVRR